MNNSDVIGVILILIFVFLVAREFVTWYWKQSKIVSLLESINSHLEKLTDQIPESDLPEEDEEIISK